MINEKTVLLDYVISKRINYLQTDNEYKTEWTSPTSSYNQIWEKYERLGTFWQLSLPDCKSLYTTIFSLLFYL